MIDVFIVVASHVGRDRIKDPGDDSLESNSVDFSDIHNFT